MTLTTIADDSLFQPLILPHGPKLKNRLALAPLTNTQSHGDGTLSDDEYRWLTMRAAGGFGLIKTCAIAVEERGRGYPGQLGAWNDKHISGLTRLAEGVKAHDALACAQLSHSGPRALLNRIGVVAEPGNEVRELSNEDIATLIQRFVDAAQRCEKAGFDGVELHAAHGFLPAQFLSPDINTRTDNWGGDLTNRARFIREILEQIRSATRTDFQLGLRLSPERFGLRMAEILELAQTIMASGVIDWLDMSLWDVFKLPEEIEFADKPLLSWFAELDRGQTRLGAAGNILSRGAAVQALELGADYVDIGKAAILAHDFPQKVADDIDYKSPARPVSEALLREQGLGQAFINYMRSFEGFVE